MENKINKKRIVIALGGNALGDTLEEQMNAVKITAKNIVDLVESGCEVIIAHGNGPQVGFINNAMTEYANNHKTGNYTPLSVCVAMSQAYIGYDLQNALMEEFSNRNLYIPPISTLITQVIVDENDSAFKNPTKPIGQFMTKEESEIKAKELNWVVKEDAGRGYRRVVASPKPIAIVESTAIKATAQYCQEPKGTTSPFTLYKVLPPAIYLTAIGYNERPIVNTTVPAIKGGNNFLIFSTAKPNIIATKPPIN